jgi:hypothetical protein
MTHTPQAGPKGGEFMGVQFLIGSWPQALYIDCDWVQCDGRTLGGGDDLG